jgi:hypothetical protein
MLKRFFDKLRSPSSQQAPPRGAAPRVPEPSAAPPSKPTTLEESQAYLTKVQEKINKLAEEFAAGVINRGQFQELYDHYRREQQTVKRWIDMDPQSEAWKELTTEGKSGDWRQYTAKVILPSATDRHAAEHHQ